MGWKDNKALINGDEIACRFDGQFIEIRYNEALEDNIDSISIDGVSYVAELSANVAGRNEILLIKVRESDESAQGRNKHRTSRKSVSSKIDARRDSED